LSLHRDLPVYCRRCIGSAVTRRALGNTFCFQRHTLLRGAVYVSGQNALSSVACHRGFFFRCQFLKPPLPKPLNATLAGIVCGLVAGKPGIPAISRNSSAEKRAFPQAITVGSVNLLPAFPSNPGWCAAPRFRAIQEQVEQNPLRQLRDPRGVN